GDVPPERAALEQVAGDVVEPETLALVVERFGSFHRASSRFRSADGSSVLACPRVTASGNYHAAAWIWDSWLPWFSSSCGRSGRLTSFARPREKFTKRARAPRERS